MTTIVTRADKGSPLTNTEMDTNLTNLNSYKVEQDISGNATITGDVYLTGSGKRITGDFSNATIANRVAFQTSTINGNTGIAVLPNGTSANANFSVVNNSNPTNAAYMQIRVGSSSADLNTGIFGTGTSLPMTFWTGGSERMRIDTAGNVGVGFTPRAGQGAFQTYKLISGGLPAASGTSDPNQVSAINAGGTQLSFGAVVAGHNWIQSRLSSDFAANTNLYLQPNGGNTLHVGPNGGLGYGTGAGGTVTQATSKSTAVTLNKPTGRILMTGDALAAGAVVVFQFNNSLITAQDMLVVNFGGASASVQTYNLWCDRCDTGVAWIALKNISGVSKSESVIINFAIIKGATE